MALNHLALSEINCSHLQRLIDGKASETRDIEYKRDTYGSTDKDHGEFLADISSFANASGGDIIIGMDAKSGVPIAFRALNTSEVDSETLRLESIARSGLQPRIFGLEVRPIPIENGAVIVVRIPRSYNQPHRIVRQGSGQHRFYARSSAGKYEPNVDELRQLFTSAPQIAERIRDFRLDRIAKIAADDSQVKLLDERILTLHVIPFSAFDTRLSLPLDLQYRLYSRFPPIGANQTNNFRINVDGLLTLSNAERQAQKQRAYVQLYHNGIVEAVASSFARGEGTTENPFSLTSIKTEVCIVQSSHQFVTNLKALGCSPPFAILVSLLGMKNVPYSFTPIGDQGYVALYDQEAGILDRDQFHFSEVIVNTVYADAQDHAKMLRPLFNQIANAAGRASTVSFDGSGQFRYRV